jgi:hypothetical protein
MTNGAGDIAKDAVKGLSAQPTLLLIAVLNVFMIGALLYVGRAQVQERQDVLKALVENCKH